MKVSTREKFQKFPLIIKKGFAVVKIYEVKNRDRINYCVSYVGPSGRVRRNFADLNEAKTEETRSRDRLPGSTQQR